MIIYEVITLLVIKLLLLIAEVRRGLTVRILLCYGFC